MLRAVRLKVLIWKLLKYRRPLFGKTLRSIFGDLNSVKTNYELVYEFFLQHDREKSSDGPDRSFSHSLFSGSSYWQPSVAQQRQRAVFQYICPVYDFQPFD